MTSDEESDSPLQRYVPLLIWIGVICSLIYIPLKIIGYGYVPPDDALRHVGKVLSGKDWSDILVLRPGVTIDHNAGWHAILGAVRSATGWGGDALVSFSVAGLCALFLLVPLLFCRRPEAWVAAMLAITAAHIHFPHRICLGRPYIFVMATFTAILFAWIRSGRVTWPLAIATSAAIGVAAWIHGGWYLYWLPAAAFFAVQQWRRGLAMTACWLAGSFFGGVLTGHPVYFLVEQFKVLLSCFSYHSLQRMLVSEFQPSDGNVTMVLIVGLVLAARAITGRWDAMTLRNPALAMVAICWVLGFSVKRFWLDWGIPALLVWLALEFEDLFERYVSRESVARLFASGLLCGALYLTATSDQNSRWTTNLTVEYLTPDNPDWAGWLPEPGGIIYCDTMYVFYQTFFKNPDGHWKYLLGFEATFMPEDDLETFRKIQWNFGTPEAYKPWVEKMKPADRLIFRRGKSAKPEFPELEWQYTATDTWVGRLPRTASSP